jgi:hypothetical protein
MEKAGRAAANGEYVNRSYHEIFIGSHRASDGDVAKFSSSR